MRTLIYQDKEKALFKQGAFFILFERTPTIEFSQGGTGTYLNELPEWYERELRDQKIKAVLSDESQPTVEPQHSPSNNDDKKV
jgi:hypothetical protein